MPIKKLIRAATKPIRRAKAVRKIKQSVEAKKVRNLKHMVRQQTYQQRTSNL